MKPRVIPINHASLILDWRKIILVEKENKDIEVILVNWYE
jgi:hypothetical protein